MTNCMIQWIDENAKPTPDHNKPVAWAQYHYAIHEYGTGKIERYLDAVEVSYLICADHLAKVTPEMRFENGGGWTFAPLPENDGRAD